MRVSINMAMSLDGKIATAARGPVKLGSAYDSRRMAQIRAEHDVVINGAATFRAYPRALAVDGKDLVRARMRKGWAAQPVSAVVSSRLDIPRDTPWEKAVDVERWIFCGARASAVKMKSLEAAGVRVVRGRGARPTAREILSAFARAGLERVLLEGGGEFNASFLEAGLVDQIHLTVVPLIVGGVDSPTWCEGKGFAKGHFPRFRLQECRKVKDELYLTYRR